ncbi:SMI1/KNR4 family protein [Planomicrobium sp. Y74]|uniref:SMI1/KNR4 family protein n=1 Tax=Planomicrobium sp. Y74 TaxID=2478977 RepID=UPI000EF46B7C|nr:SMI1/KNR4 family protein [Planomicrobium sp. Y74]RLQ89717.1 SMI1/KNR4 family protein [Planomicrobium sp. Y74]
MQEIIKLLETNKKGVEEPAIRETEQKLNIRFPDQYVQLFKLANGPEVGEWTLFPIKDPKNMKKTWDDVVRQNEEVLDGEISENLIAIAEDGTGDYLCLKVEDGKAADPIYLWLHETDETEELALTLKDFIVTTQEELEDFDED